MTESHPLKVLIAEDNAIMADVLRRALQRGGYDVQIARNGLQAAEICRTCDFDAVVTDYQMPEMDGIEFVKALRNGDRNSNTPVIFVSGKGLELDSEMLHREFDVLTVVFKPFSPQELIGHLQDCLQHRTVSGHTSLGIT